MPEVLAQSMAGPIEAVEGLHRRQLARYWRTITTPDGEEVWVQTLPLPADLTSRALYLAKGFRLRPPEDAGVDAESGEDEEKERLYAEIAALRAKNTELKQELKARSSGDGQLSVEKLKAS